MRLDEHARFRWRPRERLAEEMRIVTCDYDSAVMPCAECEGGLDTRVAAAQGDEAGDRCASSQVRAFETRLDRKCEHVGDTRQQRECQRSRNECAAGERSPIAAKERAAAPSFVGGNERKHRRPAGRQG